MTASVDRMLARCTESESGCWLYSRPRGDGYVNTTIGGRQMYGHRASYEYFRAEIPAGLHLDHLCRNRACVNPWHLEPVTQAVNTGRTPRARKTHCVNGHTFTERNTYRWKAGSGRQCLDCIAERSRRYRSEAVTYDPKAAHPDL